MKREEEEEVEDVHGRDSWYAGNDILEVWLLSRETAVLIWLMGCKFVN